MKKRCPWCESSQLMVKYHDEEWGVPVYDDKKLFEFVLLDCFQAGLSWSTIINKRENFRKAFDNFDFQKIAGYDDRKIAQLLSDPGIIRNKLKISATVTNARELIKIRDEYGSYSNYIWRFVDGKPINNKIRNLSEIKSSSPESDKLSKDLQKRGFKFSGTVICYAFMQAAGLVNDHIIDCFRHKELSSSNK